MLRSFLGPGHRVENVAVPGSALAGCDVARTIAERQADAAIIAFGMNDHVEGLRALPAFEAKLDADAADLAANGVAAMLVGFFQQNPYWEKEERASTLAYNAAIKRVARRHGLPFIDALTAFERASPDVEPFYHLTGDFMHHPNNYGQRIYFSLIAPFFLDRPCRASDIENYVVADWQACSRSTAFADAEISGSALLT